MALPAYAEFDVSAADENATLVENWLASNPGYIQGLIYKMLDWADNNRNGLSPLDRPALDDIADQERSSKKVELLLSWLRRDIGRARMRLVRAWIDKEHPPRKASPPPRPPSPPPAAVPVAVPARVLDDPRLTRGWFNNFFDLDTMRAHRMATDLYDAERDIELSDIKAEGSKRAKRDAMVRWIFSSALRKRRALQWVDMQ